MLKKICKPSMLLLLGAVVLFAGVCVGFGVAGSLGIIDYHPMDAIFHNLGIIDYHPMDVVFHNLGIIDYHPMDIIAQYIPNIL